MNDREKNLQKYMNKNLKISTLLAYRFKTLEIINAIENMTTNLPKQQWYFLQFQDYKKQRKEINQKRYKNKKIKKILAQYLLEIKILNFIINQNQIETQNLFAELNKIDLFIKKQQLAILLLNNHQVLQEDPLDLSLPKQKQLLQVAILNNEQQSNTFTVYQQYLNNMLEKQLENTFLIPKNISNEKSNSMQANNFNDIQTHLLNHPLSENDYLNSANKETYTKTVSDKQTQLLMKF